MQRSFGSYLLSMGILQRSGPCSANFRSKSIGKEEYDLGTRQSSENGHLLYLSFLRLLINLPSPP